MTNSTPLITVDGPSGAGKGTITRAVAQKLGWHLLDSGALYRLTALASQRDQIPLDQESSVADVARSLDVRFESDEQGDERIVLRGQEVTREIRTESCGEAASQVAQMPAVRLALVELQRGFLQPPGLVADGRDMGTVIFPEAPVKIFLTADPEERAQRRHKQLKDKGIDVSLAALRDDIVKRDQRDSQRSVAPLIAADDAIQIDTTGLSVDEVIELVLHIVVHEFHLNF